MDKGSKQPTSQVGVPDDEALLAVAQRLLSAPRARSSAEFARGVMAMRDAACRAIVDGYGDVHLEHPTAGMSVRFSSRKATGFVREVSVDAAFGTTVHVTILWDDAKYRNRSQMNYRMKLRTWRRWVKGARLL